MGFVKQVGQGLGLVSPDGPSAAELQAQQTAANNQQQQTNLTQNRVNQVGPDGSLTWNQAPNGTWTQTTSLSPGNQSLYNTQQQLSSQLGSAAGNSLQQVTNALANPMDTSRLAARTAAPDANAFRTGQYTPTATAGAQSTAAQTGPAAQATSSGYRASTAGTTLAGPASTYGGATASGDYNILRNLDTSGVKTALPTEINDASRKRVEEAIMSRLNPQYRQDEQALRTRLLNSGIEVGTDAYNKEMGNFSQRLNDARMQAILAGGTEESRQTQLLQGLNAQQFGQALDKGNFAQRADTSMAGNRTSADIASAGNRTSAGIASMQGENQVNLANANAANENSRFNAGQTNDADQFTANAGNETSRFNTGQTNTNNQYNAGLTNASNLANASLAQNNQQFNGAQALSAAGLNATTNNQNYNMGLASANFNNANRAQDLQEQLALRNQPLAELNALRTGSQPNTPQFGQYYTNGMGAPDTMGANAAALAQANKQSSQYGGFLGQAASFFL